MATKLKEFYRKKNVLVTGGTGFLGLGFIEKIFRSFPEVGNIYMVVRSRKGETFDERKKAFIKNPVFTRIIREQKADFSKLVWLEGDLCKADLGLSRPTITDLQKWVNVIIHSGASVKFTEPLKNAIAMNVSATNDLLDIASGCKDFSCFMHISTVYCKALLSKPHIDESISKHPIAPEELIKLANRCTAEELNKKTKDMLLEWINTYTYTKNAAENLCFQRKNQFPIAIFRPGAVMPSLAEPEPYWLGNVMAWIRALLETNRGKVYDGPSHTKSNSVPVDFVNNGMLMALYHTAIDRKCNIYNFTSNSHPYEFLKTYKMFIKNIPNFNELVERRTRLLNTPLPTEKELKMIKSIESYEKFYTGIAYFVDHPFTYSNNNMDKMWDTMTEDERKLLPFDVRSINWDKYFEAMNANMFGTDLITKYSEFS